MQHHKKTLKRLSILLLACLALCCLLVGLFRLLLMNCVISTASMHPAINAGDRLIGLRTAYGKGKAPHRGDIVTFTQDGDETLYAKRVVGLPGETVQIIGGVTYIDGVPLPEPYLAEAPAAWDLGPWKVPPQHCLVMGDNRNHSLDSRFWEDPYLPYSHITARLVLCYSSVEHGPGLRWLR